MCYTEMANLCSMPGGHKKSVLINSNGQYCFMAGYIHLHLNLDLWVAKAQSVLRLATGWTVRGSNPGGGGARFSAPVQTGPGAHPASCTISTGLFPWVNGRGVALTTHSHLAPGLKKDRAMPLLHPDLSSAQLYPAHVTGRCWHGLSTCRGEDTLTRVHRPRGCRTVGRSS